MASKLVRNKSRLSAAIVSLLCTTATIGPEPAYAAAVQASPTAATRAAGAAAEIRRVLDSIGDSDRLASASSVASDTQGKLLWVNQGPTPAQPMELRVRQQQYTDFDAGLTYVVLGLSGPESSFKRSTVLRHSDGSSDLLELMSLSPLAVVRQLAARPADLRLLARSGGRTVLAAPLVDRLVELEIGPHGLPQALSYVVEDDLLGDTVRRFEYLNYGRQGNWMVPGRVRQLDAGRLVRDAAAADFAVGEGRPQWTEGLQPRQAHPPDSSSGSAAERIAPRVYHLKQYGNSDYHGLGVELPGGWMVLETPLAIGDGTELRKALRAISAKPILYAAATHHHDDHAAGMTAFRNDPAMVLTTPGNVEYFKTMIEAPREFSGVEAKAQVVALSPDQRVGPVRFLEIDASPHVNEMLLFYLPEQRILFHSDLGRFNDDGSVEPARPHTCALWSAIQRNDLAVESIYSGHGRPGTIEDLKRAIELRDKPCP